MKIKFQLRALAAFVHGYSYRGWVGGTDIVNIYHILWWLNSGVQMQPGLTVTARMILSLELQISHFHFLL
jgi:hypothetical protein